MKEEQTKQLEQLDRLCLELRQRILAGKVESIECQQSRNPTTLWFMGYDRPVLKFGPTTWSIRVEEKFGGFRYYETTDETTDGVAVLE